MNFTTTAFLGLKKYLAGVRGWGDDANANLDALDLAIKSVRQDIGALQTAFISTHTLFGDLEATGALSTAQPTQDLDYEIVLSPRLITGITLSSDNTPLSGQVVVDILYQSASGQAPVSLFDPASKPTLQLQGGLSYIVLSGAQLPTIRSLPAGSALRLRIISAPVGVDNLRVGLYE